MRIIQAADELKAAQVTIIGIGIGALNVNRLERISSAGGAFLANNFGELAEMFRREASQIADDDVEMLKHAVRVEVVIENTPVRVGEDVGLVVKLVNDGEEDIPAGIVLCISSPPVLFGGERRSYFETRKLVLKETLEANSDVELKVSEGWLHE